jgi:hypothetical protein
MLDPAIVERPLWGLLSLKEKYSTMRWILVGLAVISLLCGCIGGETPAESATTLAPVTAPTLAPSTVTTLSSVSSSTSTTILGGIGTSCQTYRGCQSGLLCKDGNCTAPPLYVRNFIKIELQRINVTVGGNKTYSASTFKTKDGMYVELTPKPDTVGTAYSDVNNAITGEKIMISPKRRLESTQSGPVGWGIQNPEKAGKYELNVYFNENLTYTTTFEVTL